MTTGKAEPSYTAGFSTLDREVEIESLPVSGDFPSWLSGTLIRNGPARFDARRGSFRHWFDGLAMLHAFAFADRTVSYRNRYIDTAAYRSVRDQGKIGYPEFATDPCASLFGRFFTRFQRRKPTTNPNVNVAKFGDTSVALTEVPMAVEFDSATLETAGVVPYEDELQTMLTTAHPHADPRTGDLINYALRFGRQSEYRIYRQRGSSRRREVIGTVPASRPGYVHSFAITENHVVLAIFPLVVNPLSFLLRQRPFIENYRWRPELGTRIVVLDSATGTVRGDYRTDPFFAFHHMNAYEDGRDLIFDVCAYDNADVIDALYLDTVRAGRYVPMALPTRYRVDLDHGRIRSERLSDEPMELPRIAYSGNNGRPYRFCYGTGTRDRSGHDFLDQLVKLDVETRQVRTWHSPGTYPGEPVFVPDPGGNAEDAGVVLSVVLDGVSQRSFLLVLDGETFTELARAEVPHAIPYGFHGAFTST